MWTWTKKYLESLAGIDDSPFFLRFSVLNYGLDAGLVETKVESVGIYKQSVCSYFLRSYMTWLTRFQASASR